MCAALLYEGGREMNSDLKIGHVRPKNECVYVQWDLRSNVQGTVERMCAVV
jgi:hypothetical protein